MIAAARSRGFRPMRFGEDHRQIRRPVAERRIAQTLDDRRDVTGRAERMRGTSQLRAKEIRCRPSGPTAGGTLVDALGAARLSLLRLRT